MAAQVWLNPKSNTRRAIVSLLGCSTLFGILWTIPANAHKVQVSGEVGGTMHIEPNDNPRAGDPSLAWFALTQQGGTQIPLSDCNCRLAIYSQSVEAGATPVQEPTLTPVDAEGYENVPGAEITFPQVGAYELVLQGEPTTPDAFQPFELNFEVTVATGQTSPQATAEPSAPEPAPSAIATEPQPTSTRSSNSVLWLWIALPLLILGAIGFGIMRIKK
ncbi:MAG: hypothetical protein Kow00121_19540 [Elainellaceae cyanobacterium]